MASTRILGPVAGIAAAAVALGVAELVAVVTGPQSAPLVAVGGVVVDNSPEPVTEWAIDVFGVHDKTALLVGILVVLAGVAALLGAVGFRAPGPAGGTSSGRWVALAGLGVFAAIGVAAALSRHEAALTAAAPTLVGTAAAAGTFLWLHSLPTRPPAPASTRRDLGTGPAEGPDPGQEQRPGPGPDRRRFVQVVGFALGGAVVAGFGGRWLAARQGVAAAREEVALALPEPDDPAAPVPAGADPPVPGLAGYVTGNDDFYRIDTALVPPQVDPETWQLRIGGRVRHPYTLTFEDLLARPMVERYVTLACVSNQVGGELIGNARWLGVPVAELLAEAEPLPGADQVVSRSVDGWTCGTPTEVLTDGRDALLAVGMNGAPLPVEHGFPARVVVPGLYGYVSACKWIEEIELSSFDDFDAYWVPRGWAARAPIKTQSRIDTPRRRAGTGAVTVAGVAWAQHRGIDRVEVRVDEGPWQEATLADVVSVDTWRQWSWQWDATPGEHDLTVRATDATGQTQPQEPSAPAPDGATGWHTVRVEVA